MQTIEVDVIEPPMSSEVPNVRYGRASTWNCAVDVVIGGIPTTVRGVAIAFMDDHDEMVTHSLILHDQNTSDPLSQTFLVAVTAPSSENIRAFIDTAFAGRWIPIATKPAERRTITGCTIELGGTDI